MKKSARILAASLIVAAGVSIVLVVYLAALNNHNAAERDFISYWSAGSLLVHGRNPYDFQAVRQLELAAGRGAAERVLVMRNPPLVFFLVLPLGFASPKTGLILWLFLLVGIVLLSGFLIWRLYGQPGNRIHLLGVAFAPVLVCLMAGQFGIFLLLGAVLFLYFIRRNIDMAAGAALLFFAFKPHFFLPFGVALFLWSLRMKRRLLIWAGFVAALAAAFWLAWLADPNAWTQYAQMLRSGEALNDIVPTLGAQLRLLINPRAAWIQFAPEVAACLWAVWYFWTRQDTWDWKDHGLVLLLVGVVCAPYGFLTDEALLLPAVLAGLYRAIADHRSVWPLVAFDGVALALLAFGVPIVSRGYLWTPLAWLVWYLYAARSATPRGVAADVLSASPSLHSGSASG
jgi:Glycosyltransferase family 87